MCNSCGLRIIAAPWLLQILNIQMLNASTSTMVNNLHKLIFYSLKSYPSNYNLQMAIGVECILRIAFYVWF